ncbi:hypothetical protein CVM73_36785 [Bradyrhizobium forestalis]|uniref:Uncharacterized protein n=1 Tax=Bradyrhizobium forestalis TaxID=1419263 RepID=A0A2M8QXQ9_9BRAD|nr:hypothetical protein CVM73_36785 [Bradyrhizobium forestalis]
MLIERLLLWYGLTYAQLKILLDRVSFRASLQLCSSMPSPWRNLGLPAPNAPKQAGQLPVVAVARRVDGF